MKKWPWVAGGVFGLLWWMSDREKAQKRVNASLVIFQGTRPKLAVGDTASIVFRTETDGGSDYTDEKVRVSVVTVNWVDQYGALYTGKAMTAGAGHDVGELIPFFERNIASTP